MDERFWKIVVTLGVPGLALGVFFGLYNKLGFTFAPVQAEWTGPIAIVFLVLVAIVVIVALMKYRPTTPAPSDSSEPPVPSGYRRFRVLVLSANNPGTIDRVDLPKTLPWNQAANGFVVGFDLPQDPVLYRLLDVEAGTWLDAPRTIGELKTKSPLIALVHKDAAAKYGTSASDVAAVARALTEAAKAKRS